MIPFPLQQQNQPDTPAASGEKAADVVDLGDDGSQGDSGLVETLQANGREAEASSVLEELFALDPVPSLVRLFEARKRERQLDRLLVVEGRPLLGRHVALRARHPRGDRVIGARLDAHVVRRVRVDEVDRRPVEKPGHVPRIA